MPTSRLVLVKTLAVAVALSAIAPAHAFDASQVLKDDAEPSAALKFFSSFKRDGKKDEAVAVLKYAAEKGNSAAQWKLARIYQTGDGVDKDPLEAFKIFQAIAAQHQFAVPNTPSWQFSSYALVELGDYYSNGINGTAIVPDTTKAKMMYTTAAMVFRHPDAQFKLGRMQLRNDTGFGQAKLGIRNLSLANQKGHVGAQALLGYSMFEGENMRHRPVKGIVMLTKAKKRASVKDMLWIEQLHDEVIALASPKQREAANRRLVEQGIIE